MFEYSAGLGGGVFTFPDTPFKIFVLYSLTSAAYLSSENKKKFHFQQKNNYNKITCATNQEF